MSSMDKETIIKDIEQHILNDRLSYDKTTDHLIWNYCSIHNLPYDDYTKIKRFFTKTMQNALVKRYKKEKYEKQLNSSRQLKTVYITGDDKDQINTVMFHLKDFLSNIHRATELEFSGKTRNKQRIHTALRKLNIADVVTITDFDPTFISHELIMNILHPDVPHMHSIGDNEYYFTAKHVLISNQLHISDWIFESYWYNFNKHMFREKKIKSKKDDRLLNKTFINVVEDVINRLPYSITIDSKKKEITIAKAVMKPHIRQLETISQRDISELYDTVKTIPFDSLKNYMFALDSENVNIYRDIIGTIYH